MALEMGTHKIRVNSISPLLFKSEITANLMQKNWLNDVAMETVPLRKYGTSDPALTSLARYLIHDSSECVWQQFCCGRWSHLTRCAYSFLPINKE